MFVPLPIIRALTATVLVSICLLFLVASTNVANMMLARHSTRAAELVVRAALGATRARLVREAAMEMAIITFAGGVAGLGLARLLAVGLSTPIQVSDVTFQLFQHVDTGVLARAICLLAVAVLVAGLIPGWHRIRCIRAVSLAGPNASEPARWRTRRWLIVTQVTVSVLLLSVASAYISDLWVRTAAGRRFEVDRLVLAEIALAQSDSDRRRARSVIQSVQDSLAVRQDVEAVGVSSSLPIGGPSGLSGELQIAGSESVRVDLVAATPGTFRAWGIGLSAGRLLGAEDQELSPGVMVVSESIAKRLSAAANLVGREAWFQDEFPQRGGVSKKALRVVGVVSDSGILTGESIGTVYVPIGQWDVWNAFVSVRVARDPESLVGPIRETITDVDRSIAIRWTGTGNRRVSSSVLMDQVLATLAGLLGFAALFFALSGLYGVMSWLVTMRTREIGIRLALGATPGDIRRMVTLQGAAPVLTGLAVGLGFGVCGRVTLHALFIRLMPATDWLLLFCVMPILVVAAGMAACYRPSLRASRGDPNVALRSL
jgi:putative ABC transport system permease protein